MRYQHLAIICVFLFLTGMEVMGEEKAIVYLNTNKELGKVNKLILGSNQLGYRDGAGNADSNSSDRGCGIWDPDTRQAVPDMVTFAKDIGMSVVRYPGGCRSHNFDWKTTIGAISERPKQKFGVYEYLEFCSDISATPIITVAEYFGNSRDAADLAEYINAVDDGKHPWAHKRAVAGHKAPWGVIWFEFGNESDHGNHKDLRFTPKQYAQAYLEYRTAMKAVDSSIKLGVVMSTDAWNEDVLKIIGGNLDFVIPHIYIPTYTRDDGVPNANTLFQVGFAGPNQIPFYFNKLNEQVRRLTGRSDIPLAVTEYNGMFVQEKPVPYRLCLGNALIGADLVRVLMQPENNVKIANYWHFANDYWGMVKGYRKPYVLRPAYWVLWLYHQHFGDVLIDAKTDSGSFNIDSDCSVLPASGKPENYRLFEENLLPEQNWVLDRDKEVKQYEKDGILSVEIQTDEDLNYCHAHKRMPIEPSTGYLLTAEIKTEGFDKSVLSPGAQVEIGDRRGWTATKSSKLSDEVKSSEWKKVSAEYITLADAKEVSISARRLSGTLGGIGGRGRLFIRSVRVQKFIPHNFGATPFLSVNASISSDGKKVFAVIINKHLSETIKTQIEGVQPKGAKAWCLIGKTVDATNEVNPSDVQVVELPTSTVGNTINVSLPKHSMTVVEIEK